MGRLRQRLLYLKVQNQVTAWNYFIYYTFAFSEYLKYLLNQVLLTPVLSPIQERDTEPLRSLKTRCKDNCKYILVPAPVADIIQQIALSLSSKRARNLFLDSIFLTILLHVKFNGYKFPIRYTREQII